VLVHHVGLSLADVKTMTREERSAFIEEFKKEKAEEKRQLDNIRAD